MFDALARSLDAAGYPPIVYNFLLLLLPALAGWLLCFMLNLLLRSKTGSEDLLPVWRLLLLHLARPLTLWLSLALISMLLPELRTGVRSLKVLERMISVSFILSFAWLVVRLIGIGKLILFRRYDLSKKDNYRERKIRTQLVVLQRLLTGTVIFIAIAFLLLSFDSVRKIGTGLLAGVGLGGIIVGLAAQRSLGNIFAGLHIAFTQPIRIDDVLVVEGEFANVEEITLSYVVLRIWDNRRLVLPITYFLEKPFENWTRKTAEILTTVFLHMDYTVPVQALREELDRIMAQHPEWNGKVCTLAVTEAGPGTLQLRALVSANDSGNASTLQYYIREQLITFLQQHYPQSLPQTRLMVRPAAALESSG